jgi:predicted metal-dependent hydrolase
MIFHLDKKYKSKAPELFANFYKLEAKKYINNRINIIAEKNNLMFNNLKITSAKTRWGSCTSAKNINFSYRLIMAPIKTIDYVIVHELAHLTHMNHSKDFWNLVEKMMK